MITLNLILFSTRIKSLVFLKIHSKFIFYIFMIIFMIVFVMVKVTMIMIIIVVMIVILMIIIVSIFIFILIIMLITVICILHFWMELLNALCTSQFKHIYWWMWTYLFIMYESLMLRFFKIVFRDNFF